jgi:release factor glutamine methyltransferase
MIYQPAEDSYLLEQSVKDYLKNKKIKKDIKILDMGSGSGIQAQICKNLGFEDILCADINKETVEYLKKQGFESIESDLFSNVNKNDKFNLIIFNPPYLPEDSREPEDSRLATTAGKKGYEVILRFLEQSKKYLNKDGTILLLFSSLSKPKIIINKAGDLGYKIRELSNKKLFFEELFVYEFKLV